MDTVLFFNSRGVLHCKSLLQNGCPRYSNTFPFNVYPWKGSTMTAKNWTKGWHRENVKPGQEEWKTWFQKVLKWCVQRCFTSLGPIASQVYFYEAKLGRDVEGVRPFSNPGPAVSASYWSVTACEDPTESYRQERETAGNGRVPA